MKRYSEFVKKTAIRNEYREDCTKKDEYFKFWNTQTSKHSNWTSPQYYESRDQKERSMKSKEQKRVILGMRRQELSELLRKEALEQNKELHKLQEEGVADMDQLRMRHDEIREKVAAQHSAEAELQLYHQWRRDEPAIREAESSYRLGFVRNAWAGQLEEQRARTAALQAEEARHSEDRRLAALREALAAEDAEKRRQDEERRVAQMNVEEALEKLKENSRVAAELRREEAVAARMEQELFRLDQQRSQTEQARKQASVRSGLERQVVFRLRQRATEVQRELEEDRLLLEGVQLATEQAALLQAAQQRARSDLDITLRAMAQQAQQEARLAHHNANLFHEEAVTELRVLEKRWVREQAARHALLASVLAERQMQAREMREQAARQRERVQEESAALERATEHHRIMQQERAMAKVQDQADYQQQLDQQVEEKAARVREEQEKQQREKAELRQKAKEEDARLDAEMKKISLGGRRRVAWL